MANPWDQNAAPINNPGGAATEGTSVPSTVSPHDAVTAPWHPDATPINNPAGKGPEGSVWESIKSNMGARVDALAAGMLQDEGSDRSRYAMKRAERSNQEARVKESQLSGMQKVGVGAADIGTGIAMSAIPGVGPELTAAYFGAQGTADQLRQQAEENGRYDVQKAADVGIAQGAAGVGAGTAAGALVGKFLPSIAGNFAGQALTSATGGAGGGASMQMISNLANGKDAFEGVGDASLYGAVGGLGAHAAIPSVRAISRAPKTLRDIQDAGAAEFARKNPNINVGEEAPVEQPQAAPAVDAGEGAIPTGAQPPESGAIPVDNAIPGAADINPGQYGNGQEGAWNIVQPGTAMSASSNGIKAGTAYKAAKGIKEIYKTITSDHPASVLSPEKLTDSEITAKRVGIKPGSRIVKDAQALEGSVDFYQQKLENDISPDTPEFTDVARGIVKMSLQHGSAAAAQRANKLAEVTGLPMNSKFHDYEIGEGVANQDSKRNVAIEEHGIPRSQIEREHNAMKDAIEASTSIEGGKITEAQRKKAQTYESNFNAYRKSYLAAQDKIKNAHSENEVLARTTLNSIRESESPQTHAKALKLVRALDDYQGVLTQSANGKGLNLERLEPIAHDIVENASALGLSDKFKNALGEKGSFNPVVDAEAWNNFNERVRAVHPDAPKGGEKELGSGKGFGFADVNPLKIGTLVKPVSKMIGNVSNIKTATDSMARGAAMAKASRAVKTERSNPEELQAAMSRGDVRSMEDYSKSALEESGINTSGPDLAATPAQEVQAAQAQAVDPAVQAHIDTLLRGSKGIVDAQNAEGVAGRAVRPAPIEEAPVAAPEEAAPVQEGPGAFAQGNETPTQLPEALKVQETEPEVAPVQPEETAPQQVEPEAPQGPGKFAEGNTRPNVRPEPEVAPEPAQEASKGVPQKPKVKPETEEAPKEQTQEETPTTDKPVKAEETDFKTDDEGKVSETAEQRNKRVSDMAKKMVTEKTQEVLKTPIKKLSKDHSEALKMKAEAEGMNKGIKDVLEFAKDIADKEGVHHADVMTAVMSREGGIESLFRDGYGRDAIKGRMNNAVKAYKTERRQMARQAVESANEIVRNRLGEAKVGATREEMDDRIRQNLKSMGLEDKVIQGAFSKAAEAGNGNYTARHVVNYARQIMKDVRAEAKGTKPAERINHVANSREQLHKHIDSLGVDGYTRGILRRIVANHTQVGATGQRGALTEAETKAAMNDITKALADRAAEAKAALSKKPAGSPAAKAQQEKVSKIEEAQEQAEQTRGSVEADLANVREGEAKAKEAAKASEKRAQEAEAKLAEVSTKMDNFIKDFEANKAKAVADAKAELRKEATGMTTDQVEQFGKQVGEELPDSIGSTSDPEYVSWKASNDVAAEELAKRGLKADANFLRHFGDLVDKGLTRLEELPDHRDLVITQTEYNQLRDMYNKVKKGDELGVGEAGNVQMGTMGIKLRTLLLGDANARNKIRYNSDRLNAERRKALAEKEGTGSFGEGSPDIVAKPAKIEAAEATESKPKVALTPKTEAEVAYAKQKTKIARMQKKLNDDRYWAINDNEYGTKWKAHKSAIEAEKYKLNKMPKK